MSNALAVTSDSFPGDVLQSSLPVLVDLSADWCAPCRMLAPEIDKLAAQTDGRLRIFKLDVARDAALAAQYGVTSIPTMLLFVNGEVVERLTGYMPAVRIMDRLKPHLG